MTQTQQHFSERTAKQSLRSAICTLASRFCMSSENISAQQQLGLGLGIGLSLFLLVVLALAMAYGLREHRGRAAAKLLVAVPPKPAASV